jgi:ankyrin repeat protein
LLKLRYAIHTTNIEVLPRGTATTTTNTTTTTTSTTTTNGMDHKTTEKMYHDTTIENQSKLKHRYMAAVQMNEMKNMIECIHQGVPIETQDEYASNALHKASLTGYYDMVKYLIKECHLNINLQMPNGWTALHCACYDGHLAIVQYFIDDCHMDIHMQDKDGRTALRIACYYGL